MYDNFGYDSSEESYSVNVLSEFHFLTGQDRHTGFLHDECRGFAARLRPYVTDVAAAVHADLDALERLLAEERAAIEAALSDGPLRGRRVVVGIAENAVQQSGRGPGGDTNGGLRPLFF